MSSIRQNADGTETFIVDDKPFLYLGAEARFEAYMNCDKLDYDGYEKYVKEAKDLGLNVLAVSVDWADIETSKGVYDFTVIDKILTFGKKYGIKIDLLWYSALMCGDTHSWHIPEYIANEVPKYEIYKNGNKVDYFTNSTVYGKQFLLKIDDEYFMQRETLVVNKLMDFVCGWETANQNPSVLISVQIYNEVDAFPENKLDYTDSYDNKWLVKDNGFAVTKDQAWATIKTAMNNCAKAFKDGYYQIVTRTNLLRPQIDSLNSVAPGISPIERAIEVYNLDYIDSVGYDPYLNNLEYLETTITYYQEKLPTNFTHIAENGRQSSGDEGTYTNPDGEILTAVSNNCGYIIYELATPKWFVHGYNNDEVSGYEFGQGILNPYDLSDYSYTAKIRNVCTALTNIGEIVASAKKQNFLTFNLTGSTMYSAKTLSTQSATVKFGKFLSTAKGFAIEYEGYLYLFATENTSVNLSGNTFSEVSIFNNGAFNDSSNSIGTLNANTLYRVKIGN